MLRVLGRGGTSEVFLAYDNRLQNEVALKRLSPQLASSSELRESLTKEARLLARLSDRAIVRLFDLEEFSGDLWLVLEYVCGPTLREMLRNGYRAKVLDVARIMEQICKGLKVAHDQGIIHRDLKPGNLMLALHGGEQAAFTQSGRLPSTCENATIKITDFGIAKAIADSRVTVTNAFSGTPGYMAPEQFRGEPASPETDVYALGVITYELLTGETPRGPVGAVAGAHPAVGAVVTKAMSAQRAFRFPSAMAFYEALCNAIEGRSPVRVLKPARTHTVAMIVALLLGVMGGILTIVILANRPSKGTARASSGYIPYEKPIEIAWLNMPHAPEPPPPVPDALGKPQLDGLTGPRNPKIAWTVLLDTIMSLRGTAIGRDGTVYVTSVMGQACAIHEGKLLWAYKVGMSTPILSDIQFDDEGRVWFKSLDVVYCLNRDGKGGRLPLSYKMPPEKNEPRYHFISTTHELWGPNLNMKLDANCIGDVVARPGGPIYVALDSPQIMALDTSGKIEWKYTPSCDPKDLALAGPNRLLFTCDDNSIHEITGSKETWQRTLDGSISGLLADANGTIYYGDYGHETGKTRFRAIDANGKELWNVDLGGGSIAGLGIGMDHQLIIRSSGVNQKIRCLRD